jgi:hypothetical protein
VCKLSKLHGEKHGHPGNTTRRLRFSGRSGPFDAAPPGPALPQRQENVRRSPSARHDAGHDDKLGIEIRWERFQAQPKWEIPASVIANPLSGGVLSIHVSWPARPKPGRFSGVQ